MGAIRELRKGEMARSPRRIAAHRRSRSRSRELSRLRTQLNGKEYKIRKRWRYLRDQFAVELGKISPARSGDEVTTDCPKWPYFKSLLFLKAVVKPRSSTGKKRRRSLSAGTDPDTEIGDSRDSQSTNDNDFAPSSSPRITADANDQSTMSPAMSTFETASKRPKNDQMLDFEHQNHFFLQEKEEFRHGRTDADNEHLLFFKSLLSHINKIPQHMILSFRNRIQSIVDEFAYQSLQYDNK